MNRLKTEPIARKKASPAQVAARARAHARAPNFVPSLSSFCDTANMSAKAASVLGPYRNGKKWRVVYIAGEMRQSKVFDTHEEAQAVVETLGSSLSTAAKMLIGTAIDEFVRQKRRQGLKACTVKAWDDRLRWALPTDECLADIDPMRAQSIYDGMSERLAAATHRARLRYVRAFFAWTVERGYLRTNPFAGIKPTGKPRRGKLQLRVDEARILYADLMQRATAGDDRSLGLLLQLLTGLRSGEVLNLRARDVDDQGTRLCVAMGRGEAGEDEGKTDNAPRVLPIEVPELRALLLRQRDARKPGDRLIGPGDRKMHGDYLWDFLGRICKRLGLPRVCPHSLRGLHATLAVSQGATSTLVAGVLGHGSDEITKRHYIAPGSMDAAKVRHVASILTASRAPAPAANPALSALLEQVQNLSEQDRRLLIAAVADKS